MSNLKLPTLTYAALDVKVAELVPGATMGRGVPIGYMTHAYRYRDEICIQHHGTTIATLGADGAVHVTNGGYGSSTTRARLHSILVDNGIPYGVTQRNYVQVLVSRDRSEAYPDFLSAYFTADGTLLAFNGQAVTA